MLGILVHLFNQETEVIKVLTKSKKINTAQLLTAGKELFPINPHS